MLERLMGLSLRNRLVVFLGVLLVVALGTWALRTIPIDAFPDVTNVQVEVLSTSPGLSPLEIEQFVTYPIEISMRGLPGLTLMRSVTKHGLSVVTLVFRDDVDIYFARQQVHERLADVGGRLPEGVESELAPIATAMGEIYQYTLETAAPVAGGDAIRTLTDLRTTQDWLVVPLLKGIPGVADVNSFGGYIQQFQVTVDPDKLLKYDISLAAVQDAIRRNNANAGGNIVVDGAEQLVIRGTGLVRSEQDLSQIVLTAHEGTPILVRDIGEVLLGHAIRQGAALKNGSTEAVGGIVMMLRGENSRQVVARVQARVREINAGNVLPKGLTLVPFYERSWIVNESTETVLRALGEGAVLVMIVLTLFLWSVRGALVVVLALPLSGLLTFLVMRVVGLNANLMSLGGLAISIGMVIDATIIQVENVQRHLSLHPGPNKLATVLRAAVEVRKPSIFGELIIALTKVPIFTLQGMEGKMFSPLAFTVMVAVFASLLLSIFVIPVLCLTMLKSAHKESPVANGARRIYAPVLKWALGHRVVVVGIALLSLVAAGVTLPRLGTEFLPVMDEGAFDMDLQMLPGVSLETAMASAAEVERRLKQFPELDTIVSRTGQTGIAIEARGVDKTGFVGSLKPREQWTSAGSREELMDKMREAVEGVPGIVASFSQPIQCRIDELVAGTRAQLIVRLFGDDSAVLKRKAAEMSGVLGGIRGVSDLVVERIAGQQYLTVAVDRAKLARHGVNVGDVFDVIDVGIGGKPVSQVYEGNRVFDVTLRFPESYRQSVEALNALLIDAPGGYRVPLGELADVRRVEGPVQISREDGQRRIGVEINLSGRDIGGFVREAQALLKERVSLPSGYYLTWGGQFENQQKANRRLMIVTPIVIGLVFLLLLATFNSVWLATLVLGCLPFAMVGGVFALPLFGLYLSVPASVGFIVLFGVAVLNGVVLMSSIVDLREAGHSVADAVRTGCELRLRPVLMTASIAVFSLIPLVYASGPGSEVQRPLAAVVIGGLISSTFLTLLVLPVIYSWVEERRERFLSRKSANGGALAQQATVAFLGVAAGLVAGQASAQPGQSAKRLLLADAARAATTISARGQEFVLPTRLSLEEALRIAVERNPTLAAVGNSIEVARAQLLGAGLRPNPALSFESEAYPLFEPSRPPFLDGQELTLRIDQELELGGRRGLRKEAAEAGVAAADAGFRDQQRRLHLDVRRVYFAVVLAKADLEAARAALAEIDKIITLSRARQEQGEISGGEVRRIQVERLRFVDDQFGAELALRNARSSLLALLNAPDLGVEFDVAESLNLADSPATGAPPPGSLSSPLDPAALRAQALAARPDLLAATREVQRADTETRLQNALKTPNVTVGGGYVRDFGANAIVFGATVPLPLSNRNQGGIARADAERRQAAHRAAATTTAVLLDVQQAINAVNIAAARVEYIEREYLKPSRESRDIVMAAYRLGSAGLIDFLDAQRAFRDTLRTYHRALYERRVSLFQLAAATGEPDTPAK
jgi:cobalt-zinc-cadmium resistance protein CzcA